MNFDIKKFKNIRPEENRYKKQLTRMRNNDLKTTFIEEVVNRSMENLNSGKRSFVIYGDPQSGKTEMMIALTAKLLDDTRYKIIIILLNDHVGLLEQNLKRFSKSGLDPDPKNYKEILDDVNNIRDREWIIFCKKNRSDLEKLIRKLEDYSEKIIIDDEADYASPNGKINKQEQTRINQLVEELLGKRGVYIGVTATPARLDLNNAFKNANKSWIYFRPHKFYNGQEDFFPADRKRNSLDYQLKFLPDQHDDPSHLREAFFRFLINVAYLNLTQKEETHYSMIIHTSGKIDDHAKDYNNISKIFDVLYDEEKFGKYVEKIHGLAESKYNSMADSITRYILRKKNKSTVLIINSTQGGRDDLGKAADPKALFTIVIGGNIISRGVTFKNLLSMYFTRSVKAKLQQNTYIQRARMFGARQSYLKYFELTIPKQLYTDWHRCFVFHKLALDPVINNTGSPPVWIGDTRVQAVAKSDIDNTTVRMNSGEMSFAKFDYSNDIENVIAGDFDQKDKLSKLKKQLDESQLPQNLIAFIQSFSPLASDSLAIHASGDAHTYNDADPKKIARDKGFIGGRDLEKKRFPHAIHHIKIFYNDKKEARLFYRFLGIDETRGVKFLENIKS